MIDSLRVDKRGDEYFIIHQVERGETVYSLSRRYKSDANEIIEINKLDVNDIEIGQILEIPIEINEPANSEPTKSNTNTHVVSSGETLYSISRTYGVEVEDIKRVNDLTSNSLSQGQRLIIPGSSTQPEFVVPNKSKKPSYEYVVRTGDNIEALSEKFDVPVDSIMKWNSLKNSRLALGQKLYFPFEVDKEKEVVITEVGTYKNTSYGSKMRKSEEGGVTKIIEEGVAKIIDGDFDTQNYFALHRNLRVGTVLEVKNLMNNEKTYVRVVGKLPNTGINKNTMIRLTPVAFKRLGIIDQKALVEITYFNE
jgi:LysM repeat protein